MGRGIRERGRRSIIVINTITINAPETAVRSRESAWIPFTPLLSRPSFSGYITTSGNPLFGKFFGFSRLVVARARARVQSFRLVSRMSTGFVIVSRARAAYTSREYRCSLLFAIDNTDSSTRRSLVVSPPFFVPACLRFLRCTACLRPTSIRHRELILHE